MIIGWLLLIEEWAVFMDFIHFNDVSLNRFFLRVLFRYNQVIGIITRRIKEMSYERVNDYTRARFYFFIHDSSLQ